MPKIEVDPVQLFAYLTMSAIEWDQRCHTALLGNPGSTEYKIAYTVYRAVKAAGRRAMEEAGLYDPDFEDSEPLDHMERFHTLEFLRLAVILLKEEYHSRLGMVSYGGLLEALVGEVSLNAVQTALEEAENE